VAPATYLLVLKLTSLGAVTQVRKQKRGEKLPHPSYILTNVLTRGRFGAWNASDIMLFKPERWISTSESGDTWFNPNAGPTHAFGTGPRGCYGIKQAYMQLKIFFILVIWNFELLQAPAALSSFAVLGKYRPSIMRIFADIIADSGIRHPQQCYLRLREGIST
jgi:hypothetical protein